MSEEEYKLCYECRGSGEGLHEDTKCLFCGGTGIKPEYMGEEEE